jgi:predicted dehydrogenase
MARRNRRDFLKASTLAGAGMLASQTGFWVGGAEAAQERRPGPNDRLNIGIIGAGGQGGGNLRNVARTENIVALCDVDERRAGDSFNAHPKAAKYHDFRVMLDKQKNIDAVVVSTPDHQHAVASAAAIRLGKHVYCEKPLTHDVWEARQLRLLAAKHKVATQMGNQGTSNGGLRTAAEIVQSGGIGDVREVHVWTDRPGRPGRLWWNQGLKYGHRQPAESVPKTLHWDLWLGTAPERPYNHAYVPFAWRGWWDFGTGAIGDMACHIMNLSFMALKLGAPAAVSADVAEKVNDQTAPYGLTVTYEIPARKLPNGRDMVPCRLMWYEARMPPMEKFMGQKPSGGGCLLIGSRGTLYSGDDYGGAYRLLPEANFKGYQPPKPTLPRSRGHHAEWISACKGGPPAMSNFDYAGPLTELALLGNVAIRTGQRIVWDAENLRATNCPAAEQYIRRQYRKGWTL